MGRKEDLKQKYLRLCSIEHFYLCVQNSVMEEIKYMPNGLMDSGSRMEVPI